MMPTEVFRTENDEQLGRLSLIEAIRANTDAVSRVGIRADAQDKKLDDIAKALAAIDRRMAILEHNSTPRDLERMEADFEKEVTQLQARLTAVDVRLTALEAERNQRKGALGLVEWIGRNWPALIGFAALLLVLARNGMLK
jgi:hypothetical protein